MNTHVLVAKEAYLMAKQLESLLQGMAAADGCRGYHRFAAHYNRIRKRAGEILKLDPGILKSIEHVPPYDAEKQRGFALDLEQLKADLPVLQAALRTFFDFYCPPEEKKQIGFAVKQE